VVSTQSPRKRVVLLGATGSIGENTLRVIAAHPDKLELVGIAARANWEKLAAIAKKFGVRHVGIFEEKSLADARASDAFAGRTRFYGGLAGLTELAQLPESDLTLVAVVGTTGLEPTLAAIRARKEVALASKEILVLAGKFVMDAARASEAKLIPVDSEHSAVYQCIEGHPTSGIHQIVLTASGGAFRDWTPERLAHVTPADALKHPNWNMGPKVTVDSATLANKGLELIEAQWLFGLRAEQCTAVIHPQSIVHCLVQFNDGAMLAQLSPPSMTYPIQHALLHPTRHQGVEGPLDLGKLLSFEFRPIDEQRYPMLALAKSCLHAGGVQSATYNAANEVAVAAFLSGRIPYLAIPEIVGHTLQKTTNFEPADLQAVLAVDAQSRRIAEDHLKRFC
jgi:1-deoxy-D-xylulose-5-phosphate reductoisomerase